LLSSNVLLLDQNFRPRLVVVLVAQGCASSIEDVPDTDGGAEVVHVDGGVQGERVACLVGAVDRLGTRRGLVLPDAEVAVNEAVVQPEDGVRGRAVGVLHDSTDTVVSPSVGRTLGATGHAGVVVLVVATIHELGTGVDSLGVIVVTGKTMEVVVCAGTDVDSQVSELLSLVSCDSEEREIDVLTPLVIQFPPALTPPSHWSEKMEEAANLPAYLVSSHHGRLRLKPHSLRSMSSNVNR
jgi:hypothetical protein